MGIRELRVALLAGMLAAAAALPVAGPPEARAAGPGIAPAARGMVAAHLAQATSSTFVISREGSTHTYRAESLITRYTGALKFIIERAASELSARGGGLISFEAGEFDLRASWLQFSSVSDITFAGQGMDVTVLRNDVSAARDTEPFGFNLSDRITIRDLTLSANGPPRTTSDVIDFDGGNDILIARVKITGSRGDGIVFDGKGAGQFANGNIVQDCVISGVAGDGIQLLASNNNRLVGCEITDVGGAGIKVNRSSSAAAQPNKPSSDNVIAGNRVERAGHDRIVLNGGERNLINGNSVVNSANDIPNRDGIRVTTTSGVPCNDNVVQFNTAIDQQVVPTQRYGLNNSSPDCHRTVVEGNDFSGNRLAPIHDVAPDTVYLNPPAPPGDLQAADVRATSVTLRWEPAADGLVGYDVFRPDGLRIASLGPVTAYQDTTVLPETDYSYVVRIA